MLRLLVTTSRIIKLLALITRKGDNIFSISPLLALTYEEMLSLMLDRRDSNAPNQAMMFSNAVIDGKIAFLNSIQRDDMAGSITLDSPVPYDLNTVIKFLDNKDTEMVQGARRRETRHLNSEN